MYLVTINLRYLAFREGEHYYLLDRKPRYFIGYLCLPLNWLFKQKFYLITEEEYLQLIERVSQPKSGVVIPTSLTGGIAVTLSVFIRRSNLVERLVTNFSLAFNSALISILFLLAALTIALIYCSNRRKMSSLLPLETKEVVYARLFPASLNTAMLKFILLSSMMLGMSLAMIALVLWSKSLIFLMATFLCFCLALWSGAVGYNSEISYRLKR